MTYIEEIAARQEEMDDRIRRHVRDINAITFNMQSTKITAGPRKLDAKWTIDLEQDLENLWYDVL